MAKSYRSALLGLMLAAISVCSADAMAANSKPVISSMEVQTQEASPILEIKGNGFSKDMSRVKVQLGDFTTFAEILKAKKKNLLVRLPGSKLCSGTIPIRVMVDNKSSEPADLQLALAKPILADVSPRSAEPGTVVELTVMNLGCAVESNRVTFNGVPVDILAIRENVITVQVPELEPGRASVKVEVAGLPSESLDFNINDNHSRDTTTPADPRLKFINSGAPGTAGFTPLFSINNPMVDPINGIEGLMFTANFVGKHQAIINLPWTTSNGRPQTALLTVMFGRSNSLIGCRPGADKFAYARINFPKQPDQPWNPDTNPYWWGASMLSTEGLPKGNIYGNSTGASMGGIDAFVMNPLIPGKASFKFTAELVAPNTGNYEDYGENYSRAGGGVLPLRVRIEVTCNNVDVRFPAARFNNASVTMSGEAGTMQTPNTNFVSDVLQVNDLPRP